MPIDLCREQWILCTLEKIITYYTYFFYFYFRYLIESLQRSYLNTIPGSKQLDSVSKETTPFNQIFGGYIRQEVTCLRCKHVSTTYQRFMDILVEIQQANTIEDALAHFFKQKRLGQPGDPASLYKCEKCKFKFCCLVNYLTS